MKWKIILRMKGERGRWGADRGLFIGPARRRGQLPTQTRAEQNLRGRRPLPGRVPCRPAGAAPRFRSADAQIARRRRGSRGRGRRESRSRPGRAGGALAGWSPHLRDRRPQVGPGDSRPSAPVHTTARRPRWGRPSGSRAARRHLSPQRILRAQWDPAAASVKPAWIIPAPDCRDWYLVLPRGPSGPESRLCVPPAVSSPSVGLSHPISSWLGERGSMPATGPRQALLLLQISPRRTA